MDSGPDARARQARELFVAVRGDALRMYEFRLGQTPSYVFDVTSAPAVARVLAGVRHTLVALEMSEDSLDGVAVSDLMTYWTDMLGQLQADGSPWAPVDVADTELELVRRIAAGVHAMFWQRLRYRHFNVNGAPPGVQQLPAYVDNDGQKSFALNNGWWAVKGKSWQHYVSCMSSVPRRKGQLRAALCAPSDLEHPRAFA